MCLVKQKANRRGYRLTNTRLLKAKMVLFGDTISTLAAAIGINRQNASIKVNGKRDFKQNEILKIAKRYKLTTEEVAAIFFGVERCAA